MSRFPEHIRSNEVSPVAVAQEIHRMTVDEYERIVGSVHVGPISMFDPDVNVIDGSFARDPDGAIPASTVKLVIEVSVTTQAHVRGPKLIAYAKAGLPEVWLIDPRSGVGELVRYRDPEGSSYRTVDRFDVGENARAIDVSAILER